MKWYHGRRKKIKGTPRIGFIIRSGSSKCSDIAIGDEVIRGIDVGSVDALELKYSLFIQNLHIKIWKAAWVIKRLQVFL